MSAEEFQPIRIAGCDEAKVKKLSGNKQSYEIPFSLSARPPRGWQDLFEKSWRAARKGSGATKADARLQKNNVVLESTLTDLKAHFSVLKSAINDANTKYVEESKQKAEKDGKKRQRRHEEREAELASIRETLAGLDYS